MNKIVVLGANGFIGRHLVASLSRSFGGRISAFDRFSSYSTGSNHPFEAMKNVDIIVGNFFNRSDLAAVVKGAEYVFHLISSTTPATSDSDPFIDVDTNVRASIELFQECAQAGVKRVIFLSSGGTVYGDVDSSGINELTLPEPRSPYGIAKLAIEHYLRYFKFSSGLDYMVYRVANPYGPGQNVHGKQGVIPIFMHRVLTNQPITIFGDGSMVRDFIYIDDLIAMIMGSYSKSHRFNEYNIGSGKGESVQSLVTEIERCTGKTLNKKHADTPPTYVHKSVLDITRFKKEFNLEPTIPLGEGLARTWGYIEQIQ